MNTELYGIGGKYMSENKTIEQAKQELLNNIVKGGADHTADELALAYKYLCEAQHIEESIEAFKQGTLKANE